MKFNDIERENWLSSLHPNFNRQTFHQNPVLHPSHIINFEFFKKKEIVTEYISPSKICGLDYAWAYNCPAYRPKEWRMKWIDMIHSLKRLDRVIDNFKTRSEVEAHIHKDTDPKSVMQFGDHYFTTSGQHRLCLAKFLEIDKVNVAVHRYVLDRELFQREMTLIRHVPKLEEIGLLFSFYEANLHHDFIAMDTPKDISFIKKEFIGFLINRYEELWSSPLKGIKNEIKVYFSKAESPSIDNEHELYRLDPIIRKQIQLNKQKKVQ